MKHVRGKTRGFSLIEVLVALVIIGVGMLGIAKIQALAYASTGTTSQRSLAAIETSSMVAAMRANRNYWSAAAVTAQQTIQIAGAAVTSSTDGALTAAGNCLNVTCNTTRVAAYDLAQWAGSLSALLPGDTATIICQPPVLATYPVGCNITVNWAERNTAINAQSQGKTVGTANNACNAVGPCYTLYVEP